MQRLSWALGLMLLVIAGACGGDDAEDPRDEQSDNGGTTTQPTRADSGGSAGNPDFHACDLFTAEEIGAVLDEEVPEGVDYLAVASGATNCSWNFVFVEVLLEDGEDWYDAVHFADDESDVEEVEGLGDVAVWDDFLNTLDVVDDDRYISIQPIVGFLGLDGKEVAIELARTALERLP